MTAWKGIVGLPFTPANFIEYVQTVQLGAWRPQFVVLHNTAIPLFKDWHKVSGVERMRALAGYYRDDQHWSGGPHLFVADDVIWTFTPLNVPGVHSPSWNSISWGVEVVGDYNIEPLNPSVFQNACSAVATLHDWIGLNPDSLKFHHEDPETSHKGCPGKGLVKVDVIQLVKEKLRARHQGEHLPEPR